MIQLEHLTKKFGDLVAVDDLSLTIGRGEFFAMLGPNAAGKTTTIKMLAGLIKPTVGRACIAGFDIQQQPLEARRRLAYVPDFPFLYDKLTPWEFLRFTGRLFHLPEPRIEANADVLIARFHLLEFAHRPLEAACSAEFFVALRPQRYGVAPSSRLVSTKHSAPIGRWPYSDRLLVRVAATAADGEFFAA